MRNTSRPEILLSLFTSEDRAAAIVGDLTEERQHRGSLWFWLSVLRTSFALCRKTVADAPLTMAMLAMAGCALFAAPALGGAAAVGLFPHLIGSPASWIALSFFWWGGALWTGASLVTVAPGRGMAACALLAVAAVALLTAFGVTALPRDVLSTELYTTGLVAAAPLLVGGALARQRTRACGIPNPDPHR